MKGIKSEEKGSHWPIREVHPLNRGNLFLIVKRDISFFFVLTAHMPGGERQNTMSFDGGNP